MNGTFHDINLTGKIVFGDGTVLSSSYSNLFANFLNFQRNAALGTTTLLSDKLLISNSIESSNEIICALAIVNATRFVNDLDSNGFPLVQTKAFTNDLKDTIISNKTKIDSIIPEIVDPPLKRIKLETPSTKINLQDGLIKSSNSTDSEFTSLDKSSITIQKPLENSELSANFLRYNFNGDTVASFDAESLQVGTSSLNTRITKDSVNLTSTAKRILLSPTLIDVGNYEGTSLKLDNTTILFSSGGNTQSYFENALIRLQTTGNTNTNTITNSSITSSNGTNNITITPTSLVVGPGTTNSTMTSSSLSITNGSSTSNITPTGLSVPGGSVTGASNIVTANAGNQINLRTSNTDRLQIRIGDVATLYPINFLSTQSANRIITDVSTINFKDVQNTSDVSSFTYDTNFGGFRYKTPGKHSFHDDSNKLLVIGNLRNETERNLLFTNDTNTNREIQDVSTISFRDNANSLTTKATIVFDSTTPEELTGMTYTVPNDNGSHNFVANDSSGITATPVSITASSTSIAGNLFLRIKNTTTPQDRCAITLIKTGNNVNTQHTTRSATNSGTGNYEFVTTIKVNDTTWTTANSLTVGYYGNYFGRPLHGTYGSGDKAPVTILNTATTPYANLQRIGQSHMFTNQSVVLSSSVTPQNVLTWPISWTGTYLVQWNLKFYAQTTDITSITTLRFGISTKAANDLGTQEFTAPSYVEFSDILATVTSKQTQASSTCVVHLSGGEIIYFNALVTFGSGNSIWVGGVFTVTRLS